MHNVLVKEIGDAPNKTEQRCRADYAVGYQRNDSRKKKSKS
jgi:hypothetical protein